MEIAAPRLTVWARLRQMAVGPFGMLFGILYLLSIPEQFYLASDWIGAATWARTQKELEAQGVSFNPEHYIPPPIPDSTNFAALPIFRIAPDPASPKGQLTFPELLNAFSTMDKKIPFDSSKPYGPGPFLLLPKYNDAIPCDLPGLKKTLRDFVASDHPGLHPSPNLSATALFELLCPALETLRAEAIVRPDCQFYLTPSQLESRSLILSIKLWTVFRFLVCEQRLALYENNAPLALRDEKAALRLALGIGKVREIIWTIVCGSSVSMELHVLVQGLKSHQWSEQQLRDWQTDLASFDFLTLETNASAGDFVNFELAKRADARDHRPFPTDALTDVADRLRNGLRPLDLRPFTNWLSPKGWFDLDKSTAATFRFELDRVGIDPKAHRVYPDKINDVCPGARNIWISTSGFSEIEEPRSHDSTIKVDVRFQTLIDQAQIACCLERFWLRHRHYPARLSDLEPDLATGMPNDVMTGKPDCYRLQPDGTYVLYSTAWNQLDDGGNGKVPSNVRGIDAPDWVWPNH